MRKVVSVVNLVAAHICRSPTIRGIEVIVFTDFIVVENTALNSATAGANNLSSGTLPVLLESISCLRA